MIQCRVPCVVCYGHIWVSFVIFVTYAINRIIDDIRHIMTFNCTRQRVTCDVPMWCYPHRHVFVMWDASHTRCDYLAFFVFRVMYMSVPRKLTVYAMVSNAFRVICPRTIEYFVRAIFLVSYDNRIVVPSAIASNKSRYDDDLLSRVETGTASTVDIDAPNNFDNLFKSFWDILDSFCHIISARNPCVMCHYYHFFTRM